jgi:hypothetical protein
MFFPVYVTNISIIITSRTDVRQTLNREFRHDVLHIFESDAELSSHVLGIIPRAAIVRYNQQRPWWELRAGEVFQHESHACDAIDWNLQANLHGLWDKELVERVGKIRSPHSAKVLAFADRLAQEFASKIPTW